MATILPPTTSISLLPTFEGKKDNVHNALFNEHSSRSIFAMENGN